MRANEVILIVYRGRHFQETNEKPKYAIGYKIVAGVHIGSMLNELQEVITTANNFNFGDNHMNIKLDSP